MRKKEEGACVGGGRGVCEKEKTKDKKNSLNKKEATKISNISYLDNIDF